MQEIYLYGVGRSEDIEQSYLYGQLVNHAYQLYLEKEYANREKMFIKMMRDNQSQYSLELLELARQALSPAQQKHLDQVAQQRIAEMNWDYQTWKNARDPVPPKP